MFIYFIIYIFARVLLLRTYLCVADPVLLAELAGQVQWRTTVLSYFYYDSLSLATLKRERYSDSD